MSSAQDVITPELFDRLSRLLGARVTDLKPMPGGHSGITLISTTESGERAVVKVAAPGRPAVGRHDVLRQARVMQHVAPYVPVPAVIATDETDNPVAIVSFASGVALEPAIDETGADLPAALVERRFDIATDLLATLHRTPVEGLGDEEVSTPASELALFRRICAAGSEEFQSVGDAVGEALAQDVPEPWRVGLVHGDYRLGNIMFDGEIPRAIVDWEIWTLGDPRVDLGWLATFADVSHFPVIGRTDVTVPGVDHVVDAYAAAVGAPVPDTAWFLRLGAFRMGAMMSHNLHRHRTGRHHDPYQETLPPTIERLMAVAAGSTTD